MTKIRFLLFIILISIFPIILLCGCTSPSGNESQLATTAAKIQKIIQLEMDNLDRDMSAASSRLSSTGLGGADTMQVLNTLCSKHPYIVDCCTANTDGKMVTVVPEAYSKYEGSDISKQDPTLKFNQSRKPMLSQVFRAIEGFDAVVLTWPVLSGNGDLIGSMSVLFKPETLYAAATAQVLKGTEIEIMGLQTDGYVLYTSESTETAKNLFTDPMYQPYKELLDLGARIVTAESGSGSYTFTSHAGEQPVKKLAYWVSVALHGTPWRVIAITEASK
jgi:hypothetical protein